MGNFEDDDLFGDAVSGLDYVTDVLAAPIRGAEGFLQAGYGLADALTFDALPDWERRLLGQSRTTAGSLVELFTQFGLGFAAAPATIGLAGSAFSAASRIRGFGSLASGASRLKKGAELLRGTGLVANAAKGAVADFAYLESQESVLNSIASVMGFEEELGGFFGASAEEVGFFEGRLRNALEGLALGTMIDGIMIGARKIRGFKRPETTKLTKQALIGGGDQSTVAMIVDGKPVRLRTTEPSIEVAGPKGSAAAVGDAEGAAAEEAMRRQGLTDTQKTIQEDEFLQAHRLSPVEREASAEELINTYGAGPLRDPQPGDLPKPATGDEIQPTMALLKQFEDGDIDVMGLTRDGKSQDVMNLIRDALEADIQTPGMKALVGQAGTSADELAEYGARTLSDLGNLPMSKARSQLSLALKDDAINLRLAQRHLVASRFWMLGAHKNLAKKIDLFAKAGDLQSVFDVSKSTLNAIGDIALGTQRLASELGRGLNTLRLLKEGRVRQEILQDTLGRIESGALKGRALVRAQKAELRNLQRFSQLAKSETPTAAAAAYGKAQRGLAIVQELFRNSLLGGIRTFTVTGIGGTTMSLMRPMERSLGELASGQFGAANRVWREFWTDIHTGFRDSVAGAVKSFVKEGNILDPRQPSMFMDAAPRTVDVAGRTVTLRALSSANLGIKHDTIAGTIVDVVGRTMTLPQNTIGSIDQFFRQQTFRTEVGGQLRQVARKNGIVDEKEIEQFVLDQMKIIVNDGQALTKTGEYNRVLGELLDQNVPASIAAAQASDIVQRATDATDLGKLFKISQAGLEAGNEVAFTKTFEAGSLKQLGKDVIAKIPGGNFVIPFYSTPVQIIGAMMDRSLVGIAADGLIAPFQGRVPKILKELRDPATRVVAKGKLVTAVTTSALAFDMVDQGILTGGGPVDNAQRQAKEATGWRPYSIKVDDVYYSIARLDPIAGMLGLMADMREGMMMIDPGKDQLAKDVFNVVQLTINGNIIEKSFMTGLSDFLDIFSTKNAGDNAQRYLARIGADITGPGILRNISDFARPEIVQAHTFWENFSKRWSFLPGIDNPEPFRDILGSPRDSRTYLGGGFLPIEYSSTTSDIITGEIARLGMGIRTESRVKDGVNLKEIVSVSGQSAYDRWTQLKGQVKVGGRTLRDTLSRTIRSRSYRKLPDETSELQSLGLGSPKEQELQVIMSRFRARAFETMLKEYPELQERERVRTMTQRLARQGRLVQ